MVVHKIPYIAGLHIFLFVIHLRYSQVSFGRRVAEEVSSVWFKSSHMTTYALDDDLSCIHGYRVGELEHTRLVEMERLQQSLREEGERREAAERALEELKGEVSIGMEDLSLSPSPEGESNGERNMGVWKSVCMCL